MLIVLALIFASFVAIFALQNAQTVPIRVFAWERETSIAVIALSAAALGALSAVLAGLVRQLALGLRNRHLKGELARTKKELDAATAEVVKVREELRRAQEALQQVKEVTNNRAPAVDPSPRTDAAGGPPRLLGEGDDGPGQAQGRRPS